MIKLWIDQRFDFIPDGKTFKNGSVKLSSLVWYDLHDWYNVKIGMNLLDRGYKI